MLRRHEEYCSVIWSKYVCHSRGHKSVIHILIKILFPLCTCSMHIWNMLRVSNSCINYCRRSCGDTNSTTVWYDQIMFVIQGDNNSAMITWIKILFPFMQLFNAWLNCVASFKSLCQILQRSCGDENTTTKCSGRKYTHKDNQNIDDA